jgi:hypothetical protein
MIRRISFYALVAVLLCGFRVHAQSARDELLRLVPDDVGFCLLLEDLRGHTTRLLESPFVKQFEKSAMETRLKADADWRKFTAGRDHIESLLGIEWPKLRDDIAGDAVVIAVRPGGADKPNDEKGIVLLRARDAMELGKLITRINALQQVGGEFKAVEAREHKGQGYFERVGAKTAPFYALIGPLLIVASDEAFLREALDRRSSAAEPVLSKRLRELLGPEPRLVSLWLNPRAFDAEMAAKAEKGSDEQKAALRNVLTCWKALDGAAFGLGIHDDISLTLAAQARTDRLSPATRRFFTEAAKPSELWRRFPDNALFACAGRFDMSAFEEMLGEFLTANSRKTLHDGLNRFLGAALDKDVVKEVLPCLGPDFGMCLIAPQDGSSNWLPHAIAAVRVRPGDKPPALDHALYAAATALAQAAVVEHNRKNDQRMVLKTAHQDKVEIKYLTGAVGLPAGLQPAFALKDGYFVLATSPDALLRFAPNSKLPTDEVPFVRVSLVEVRKYLQAHRNDLVTALAKHNKAKPEEVQQHLDGLMPALELFDRLEISQRGTGGRTAVTVRIRTAQALHK